MSWRTVVITKRCKLDLKMNCMVIRSDDETRRVVLDEIFTLIIENTAVSMTGCLLCELTAKKVKVIFCDEKRNPSSELMPYSLDFSPEFDVSYLLKAVDFRFDTDYDSLAEQIIDYMETVNAPEGKKCFVLVNLRNYLDDECINSFYKTVLYKKLCILMVSANDYSLSPYEQKIIIDKDLCVI